MWIIWKRALSTILRTLERIHAIPHPQQMASQRLVIGRWLIGQNPTRLETFWPEVWWYMSKCVQKKAEQQWDMDKLQIQAGRQIRNIHDISSDEVEECDAIVRNARKKLEISVEPAMPRAKQVRIPTAEARRRELQCQKVLRDPWFATSEGRPSPTQRERPVKTFRYKMFI